MSDKPATSLSHATIDAVKRPVRPVFQRFYSLPELPTISPARHHMRIPNANPRTVKLTPSITVAQDATGRSINEYKLMECVGQGSYGLVYRATDHLGSDWAVKEYAKSQLIKANQRALLQRKRQGRPWNGRASELIAAEIAIMKRIDHPNLVDLHEVLEDDDNQKLYMVLEWCENGTVMPSDPADFDVKNKLDEEQCRLYFRDMILGVEYLHAHGIVHRDIKADNCLLGEGDVLKLADFGVSEMFESPEDDLVKSTAGSPAYWAPELAKLAGVAGDGMLEPLQLKSVSGRKTDVWAMGVTLWYMYFGRLPFEAETLHEMYRKILFLPLDAEMLARCPLSLADVLVKMMEKDPGQRISIGELRVHPWITRNGLDMLLTAEENVADGSFDDSAVTEAQLMSAIEHIRQIHPDQSDLDVAKARRSLLRDLGWRGSVSSASTATSTNATAPTSPRANSFSLDEIDVKIEPMFSSGIKPEYSMGSQTETQLPTQIQAQTQTQTQDAELLSPKDPISPSQTRQSSTGSNDGENVAKLTKALDEIVRKLRWSSVS